MSRRSLQAVGAVSRGARRRRAGLVAGGGALLLSFLAPGGPSPAAAQALASVDETGWWTQRPGALEQPADGVEVAVALGGDEQSVAAVRLRSRPGATVTSLVLIFDEVSAVGEQLATLQACSTADAWVAANPGEYDDRPEADCTRALDLERDENLSSWTVDVAPLLDPSGTTSIVIVPTGEELADGLVPIVPGFQIQLTSPQLLVTGDAGDADPTTVPASPPPVTSDASAGTPPPQPAPPPPTPSPAPGTGSVDPGDLPPVEPDAADEPADGSDPVTDDEQAVVPFVPTGGDARPWGRLLLLVPLSALSGAGALVGRRWLETRASTGTTRAPAM